MTNVNSPSNSERSQKHSFLPDNYSKEDRDAIMANNMSPDSTDADLISIFNNMSPDDILSILNMFESPLLNSPASN